MKKIKSLLLSAMTLLAVTVLSGCDLIVFDPKGPQAAKLTDLINFSLFWMAVVIIGVMIIYVYVLVKYRDTPDNKNEYDPEEKDNHKYEFIWTAIPFIIVIILTIPTIKVLFELEEIPEEYAEIEPITIHVTSADWKWIFSYPEQDIETVNYVFFPVDTPVTFKLTSAGTMQSFWIPSLAGQKYTMANMEVDLLVIAEQEGSYWGQNTNFNGEGYAHMNFEAIALSHEEFNQWVTDIKERAPKLTEEEYYELLQPSVLGQIKSYSNTHLDWVNHANHDAPSTQYLSPEKYLQDYEYPGKIFDIKHFYNEEEQHGGDHSGH